MKWNGRSYRPANAQFYTNKKPFDFQEALKPYGEKEIPVWQSVVAVNVPPTEGPQPTPSLTPSPTPTPIIDCYWNLTDENWNNNTNDWNECQNVITPTPTNTATNTPTPSITPSASPAAFDADAASYLSDVLSAGGTLNATMSAATNTLFTSLKSAGLYTKMTQFYPMLGGVSSSMGLMGKRASGDTFDITWYGGWSYSTSGATGNGSNTYATFNISGTTVLATDSHLSVYGNLPNNNTGGYDLSINENNSAGRVQQIILDFNNSGNGYYEYSGYATVAGADTADFIVMSRNAAGTQTIRARNGVALSNKTETCNNVSSTRQWMLGCEQTLSGTKTTSTSNRYCWVGFGTKLTPAELLSYQSIINTFQTSLGRNTY